MIQTGFHFTLLAKEGTTVLRSAPSKNDTSVYYVDLGIIGMKVGGQASAEVAAQLKPGMRVDVTGDMAESEFNGKKENRYYFHSATPVQPKAPA